MFSSDKRVALERMC